METVEAAPEKMPGTAPERSGTAPGERVWDAVFNVTMIGVVVACAYDIGSRMARRQYAQALADSLERERAAEQRLKAVVIQLVAAKEGARTDEEPPQTEEGEPGD